MMTKEQLNKTKVKVKPEEDKKVQEYLFSLGINWPGDNKTTVHYDRPYLFIQNDWMTYSKSPYWFTDHAYKEVFVEDILGIEESLDQKYARLKKELEEAERKMQERDAVKVEDYIVFFETAAGWGIHPENIGCICRVEWIGGTEINSMDVSDTRMSGQILNPMLTNMSRFHTVPVSMYDKPSFRKATQEEIDNMVPRSQVYTTYNGYRLIVSRKSVLYQQQLYSMDKVRELAAIQSPVKLINYDNADERVGYTITIKDVTYHIGCDNGPDITLTELREIIKIADSL